MWVVGGANHSLGRRDANGRSSEGKKAKPGHETSSEECRPEGGRLRGEPLRVASGTDQHELYERRGDKQTREECGSYRYLCASEADDCFRLGQGDVCECVCVFVHPSHRHFICSKGGREEVDNSVTCTKVAGKSPASVVQSCPSRRREQRMHESRVFRKVGRSGDNNWAIGFRLIGLAEKSRGGRMLEICRVHEEGICPSTFVGVCKQAFYVSSPCPVQLDTPLYHHPT
ncbi:unnamed protein product, partial [Protopolystoma xenopodis]